jgi:hypothetical protein
VPTGPFYVYALKDPRHSPPKIFYVGKGVGPRSTSHLDRPDETPKGQRIQEIRRAHLEPQVETLVSDLSDEDAHRIEAQLIATLGTTATGGLLTNAVIPSGRGGRARRDVAIPVGSVEKAQLGLALIKDSVLALLAANSKGLENADVTNALGLQSDHEGKSINYLSYSLLGILLREGSITKERSGTPARTRYRKRD